MTSPTSASPPSLRSRQSGSELPDKLQEAEKRLFDERRRAAQIAADAPTVGLALSGGGIRSATFALGVLQALAGRGWKNPPDVAPIERVDYLSTVSGGGYIGSFFGKLFQSAGGVKPVRAILGDNTSRELKYLRENARYLSPNGAGDTALAVGVLLRNWVALQIVLGLFFLLPFLAWNLLRALALPAGFGDSACGWLNGLYWTPSIFAPALTLVAWVIPAGWAYWLVPGNRDRSKWIRPWRVMVGILLAEAAGCAYYADLVAKGGPVWNQRSIGLLIAFAVTALTIAFWLVAGNSRADRAYSARHALSVALKTGLMVSLGLFLFALVDAAGQTFYAVARIQGVGGLIALASVTFAPLVASGQKVMAFVSSDAKRPRPRLPIAVVAALVAFALAFVWMAALSAASHAIAWGGQAVDTEAARALVAEPAPRDVSLREDGAIVVAASSPDAPECSTPAYGQSRDWLALAFALGITGVLSLLLGQLMTFINQSSHASLYSARLTRAYLGASNPNRASAQNAAVTDVIDGDDVEMSQYRPYEKGGPLHFVNLTVNETVDGRSQLEQRDRKGLSLAIGPAGLSVAARHHAVFKTPGDFAGGLESLPVSGGSAAAPASSAPPSTPGGATEGFRVFQPPPADTLMKPEPLSLGRWVGLSGAAVSTGLGSRTSLGLSLLCGFFNLRLGHWWWSDTEPAMRPGHKWRFGPARIVSRLLPVQGHLVHELLARFPGTQSRYWYLSDGGHFENTGVYELIRRRVEVIIAVDAGADELCQFADLASLVRKARVDFRAEITFLTAEDISRQVREDVARYLGTLDQIRGKAAADGERRFAERYAALAVVRYDDDPTARSLILYVKPALLGAGSEPVDVLEYAATHRTFPHESTGDQYFDEAQWESYRCLGEHIARCLFSEGDGPSNPKKWHPELLGTRSKGRTPDRDLLKHLSEGTQPA